MSTSEATVAIQPLALVGQLPKELSLEVTEEIIKISSEIQGHRLSKTCPIALAAHQSLVKLLGPKIAVNVIVPITELNRHGLDIMIEVSTAGELIEMIVPLSESAIYFDGNDELANYLLPGDAWRVFKWDEDGIMEPFEQTAQLV